MSQASYATLVCDCEALKAEVAVKAEVIEKLEARIAELVDQDRLIAELRCEIAELKGRLNTNSHNSSKPPSVPMMSASLRSRPQLLQFEGA